MWAWVRPHSGSIPILCGPLLCYGPYFLLEHSLFVGNTNTAMFRYRFFFNLAIAQIIYFPWTRITSI